MMFIESYITKIKRAEVPGHAYLRNFRKSLLAFHLPIPRALDSILLLIHYLNTASREIDERVAVACFGFPLFRAMCVSIGKRLQMEVVPSVSGSVRIYLGDDVRLSGRSSISAGRVFSEPEFKVGNRTFIGHGCNFAVAKSITVGDDVLIAGGCNISDYSGHPLDPEKRIAGFQVDPADVRQVRIGNKSWLGKGVTVLPGVTIGECAVVGAASVVTKDVPPGRICVGNPGRLLARTVYESRARRDPPTTGTMSESDIESVEESHCGKSVTREAATFHTAQVSLFGGKA
jgi:serine acetyltransferase